MDKGHITMIVKLTYYMESIVKMINKKKILILFLMLSSIGTLFATNHTPEDLRTGNDAGSGASMEDFRDELPEDYFEDESLTKEEEMMNLPEEQEIQRAEAEQSETPQTQGGNQQPPITQASDSQLSQELEQTNQKVNALQSNIDNSQEALNSKINVLMIMLGVLFFMIILLVGFVVIQSKK